MIEKNITWGIGPNPANHPTCIECHEYLGLFIFFLIVLLTIVIIHFTLVKKLVSEERKASNGKS